MRLIDLAEFFTPGECYRDAIEMDGRIVRGAPGRRVHLNTTGMSLAAGLIIRAPRAERILR